ncbi:hypothetical protein [Methylobacter sp.]|uniref:hypothetical protein n=1 Tax=Methylobacter sp. TaxID=2051955 RepID=UPI003DA66089
MHRRASAGRQAGISWWLGEAGPDHHEALSWLAPIYAVVGLEPALPRYATAANVNSQAHFLKFGLRKTG